MRDGLRVANPIENCVGGSEVQQGGSNQCDFR